MKRFASFAALFSSASFVFLGLACSSTTGGATAPGGGGGATAGQVTDCKSSCDKMKFFGCNSAAEQAACYQDCDTASASQIQLFTGCATSSVCDPACRTNIMPAPSGASSGGSSTASGGGASASSCGTACDKLVTCNLIPIGAKSQCGSVCQEKAYQYQIDCVNNVTCDKIKASCGDPTTLGDGSSMVGGGGTDAGTDDSFDIMECQQSCDTLNFFSCLDADTHSACRDRCAAATATQRDTFRTCAQGAGSDCMRGQACYATFQK